MKFRMFFRKLRKEDYYKLKVDLIYTVNSRGAKATY